MRRIIRRLQREEKGSVTVIFCFVLVGLVGLAALGTDVGRLTVERQRLSNIADAAALSSAQHLPHRPELAKEVALEYLAKNGVDQAGAQVRLEQDGRSVSVQVSRTIPMTFAKVIGYQESTLTGGARARTDNLSGYLGAAPLGVPQADFQVGQRVVLKLGVHSEGDAGPGNYQALALGKTGASSYEHNLRHGYNQWLRVGDWVLTETGNMAGPTERAVNFRISQDPDASYETVTKGSSRLLIVPIIRSFDVNGRSEVQIMGFGMFFLEAATAAGNKAEVTGRFLHFISEGEANGSAPDYGVYVTKLVN